MPVTLDVVGKTMAPLTYEYTDREVILYALGVGAGTDELQCVYEQAPLKVIPTFGVVPAFPALMGLNQLMTFNPIMLLHGEQRIEVRKPFPPKGKVTTTGSIKNIWDKGSGAVVVTLPLGGNGFLISMRCSPCSSMIGLKVMRVFRPMRAGKAGTTPKVGITLRGACS